MDIQRIAASIDRAVSVLRRRPHAAASDDSAAIARWKGGLRASVHDAAGRSAATDMPVELGGEGDAATPGWLLRAGLASCALTRIAMAAALDGIALETLEVRATSRSDARGLLGVAEPDGTPVPAAPRSIALHVRLGAPGVSAERLRELVASTTASSPVTCAIEQPLPVALHVEVRA